MPDYSYRSIRALLASKDPAEIQKGLRLVAIEITKLGSTEARPLFEMVTSLFYIDTLDHPELVPVVDEAVSLAARFGAWAIPILIDNLDAGDIKAQWAMANALGRIGAIAIDPMLKAYASARDTGLRSFILYALGKIKSDQIEKAAAIACAAAQSDQLELRDTAIRAIGKFAESIPSQQLSPEMKQQLLQCLRSNLSDENPNIRAKSIRSLGKLAKFGHLTELERRALQGACREILGTDDKGEWDRAFIVRKEAEEACLYL